MIDPQYLANVGTFCVDAVGGHSVSTIKLNGAMSAKKDFEGAQIFYISYLAP